MTISTVYLHAFLVSPQTVINSLCELANNKAEQETGHYESVCEGLCCVSTLTKLG